MSNLIVGRNDTGLFIETIDGAGTGTPAQLGGTNFFRVSVEVTLAELQALDAGIRTLNKDLVTMPAGGHFVNAFVRIIQIIDNAGDDIAASISVGSIATPEGVLRSISASGYNGVVQTHANPAGDNTGTYGPMVVQDTMGGESLIVQILASGDDLNQAQIGHVAVDFIYMVD